MRFFEILKKISCTFVLVLWVAFCISQELYNVNYTEYSFDKGTHWSRMFDPALNFDYIILDDWDVSLVSKKAPSVESFDCKMSNVRDINQDGVTGTAYMGSLDKGSRQYVDLLFVSSTTEATGVFLVIEYYGMMVRLNFSGNLSFNSFKKM